MTEWEGGTWRTRPSRKAFLTPIVGQMERYDELRTRLQHEGGDPWDLGRLASTLDEALPVETAYGAATVKLTDPKGLQQALWDVPDLRIQVRRHRNGLPTFYVCQIREDYWGQYSLVVRDWYVSPDYPFGGDTRFVQIVDHGRETWFLRLSPFRKAARALCRDGEGRSGSADRLLYTMGRYVFSAAWHEDQGPAMVAARQVRGGLPRFLAALELFYLVLTANLTELRTVADDRIVPFLTEVYPQTSITTFLETTLVRLDGRGLNDLPRVALGLYARLGQAFSAFLRTEVPWGLRGAPLPLHKVLFANWHIADRLPTYLEGNEALNAAAHRLERRSEALTRVILD